MWSANGVGNYMYWAGPNTDWDGCSNWDICSKDHKSRVKVKLQCNTQGMGSEPQSWWSFNWIPYHGCG